MSLPMPTSAQDLRSLEGVRSVHEDWVFGTTGN